MTGASEDIKEKAAEKLGETKESIKQNLYETAENLKQSADEKAAEAHVDVDYTNKKIKQGVNKFEQKLQEF